MDNSNYEINSMNSFKANQSEHAIIDSVEKALALLHGQPMHTIIIAIPHTLLDPNATVPNTTCALMSTLPTELSMGVIEDMVQSYQARQASKAKVICPDCNGTGFDAITLNDCEKCDADGKISAPKTS
jgi:hypothetical protein